MTEQIKNGGPAYPSAPTRFIYDEERGPVPCGHEGMTLRDWFAGHAPDMPPEIMTVPQAERITGLSYAGIDFGTPEHWAFWAAAEAAWKYMHADAMLKARGC